MSFTREQALAVAGVLALAFADEAAAPPGGTIAQGAAAANAGAAGLHKGTGGPKKVATAPGSVKYHAPIGALIIPHGHPGQGMHYVHGQPGHEIHSTSEAKWLANQWKDKDKASEAAEKAVAAGTHHWVQAGEHSYAVHNGLEVHVPKDTDVHNPAEVKNAPKVVVKPGEHPEHVMLKPEGAGEVNQTEPGQQHLLESDYKKLPAEPAKKAVQINGKHAAWVPHDWQVHQAADTSAPGWKYAKDPQGHWHTIDKNGKIEQVPGYNQESVESFAKSGELVPETEHPGPAPSHVAPNQAAAGHEPGKIDVGGVAVTKDEIHSAIQHLNEDKSTAVKQPLAKKGHPLAAMDYHGVAKAELAKHPELKIPPGTKKAHVGQVKVAVLHHLAAAADKLAADEAHAAAAEEAKDKAEAAAAHAQQLTPGTYEVGGVHVTAQEIQAAIAKLEGSVSTQIKGLLKGNPLAGSDYWSVVNAYKEAHPAEFGTGTKQAHVAKAKPLFVAALKELAAQAATGEVQSGHDEAAQIHADLMGKYVKDGWPQSSNGAVVKALVASAGAQGHTRYAYLGPEPGTWLVSMSEPAGKAYYEVTPEHKVIFHLADGKVSHEWPVSQVAEAVKEWTSDSLPPEPKAPEPKAPEPVPKPILDTAAWKATPEYAAVHDLIANHPPGLPPHDNKLDTDQQLAAALYLAGKAHQTRYLYPAKNGDWTVSSGLPAGVAGTFGMPGKAYYEVTGNHEIIAYGSDGQGVALPGEQVKEIAEKWLTPPPPPEPVPEPPTPAEPDIHVEADGTGATFPAGSQVYVSHHHPAVEPGSDWADVKYVKKPDGTWHYVQKSGAGPMAAGVTPTMNAEAQTGKLVPWTEELASKPAEPPKPEPVPEPEPAPEPGPSPDIAQLKTLLVNGAVKTAAESGGKENPDWALVTVMKTVAKLGKDQWLVKQGWNNFWQKYSYEPYFAPDDKTMEFYHVAPDLTVTHHANGTDTTLAPEKVAQIAHDLVVPDSVKLQHPVTGEWQMFKHGFYYKTSKNAKVYLEVKPWEPGSAASGAKFLYHAPSGTKEVNASYAAKVLQDATDYHAQAKETPATAAAKLQVSYATAAAPGTYMLWSDITKAPSPEHSAKMNTDGSILLTHPGSSIPLPAQDSNGNSPVDALVKGGSLLDIYGTSVVKPGVATEKYHIFGSEAKTPDQVKELLTKFEQNYGDEAALKQLMPELVPGLEQKKLIASWGKDKLTGTSWESQRDAIMSLLKELLAVPAQDAAAVPAPQAVFLKGLPPGIHTAHDVFAWTDKGYAKPHVFEFSSYDTATELAAKIKEISAAFGDGKVVGTHPSALAKDAKLAWLQAWQAGDMAKIFAYDSSGGKVSPVHPGAPDNTSTHHITWAPWDESQVPAAQQIEGNWSPLDVQPTKAEVDNYLIKAGLKHAAFLSTTERRLWVKMHRAHDQVEVDTLSKTAATRFADGSQPLSEPPVWSDHVEPAKTYTVVLEDGKPALQWTSQAKSDFVAEHKEELLPFAGQAAAEQGSGMSPEDFLDVSYYNAYAIQKYLDHQAAVALAEKLRPKYALKPGEPGRVTDQFGHEYQWHPGTGKDAKQRLAVYELARAWGLKTPRVSQVQLEADGTKGTITDLLDHNGTLSGLTAHGMQLLSPKELAGIAAEHVFDQAIANPSSTPGDYVRSGGSVIGTGKSGAFTGLGWNGADLAHLNDVTQQPVSTLFDAIAQGFMPQDKADQAYIAAVRQARRMAALPGSRLAAILNAAGVPIADQTDLFSRVDQLPDAIQGLWDQVYAKRGWTPPEVPVAKLPHGLHSGFSEPEFFDHVMAAKASGVPAFFAGPHLEDGNFLVWTEKAGQNRYVRGESSLRGDALAAAVKWAQAHVTGGEPQPKPVSAPEPQVKNTTSWYAKIIGAAKAVSIHAADQNFEGNWTKQKLTDLATLKTELADLVAAAEKAQPGMSFEATYGPPDLVKQAAAYYLSKIAQVEEHKANGLAFKPGDIPDWTPPPKPEPEEPSKPEPPKGLKVEYLKATRILNQAQATQHGKPSGDIHGPDGELQLGNAIYEYPGYAWHITLPTGEVIELSDEATTSSPQGHYGRVRFRAVASDGSASLERIRSQLQGMGVPLEEAAPEDMELFYWRHLAYVLADRKDRQEGKHAQVWASLGTAVPAAAKVADETKKVSAVIAAGLDPAAELDAWHKAWANLTSAQQVQEFADKGGHLPHLPHLNTAGADVPAGKPYWYRFDADPKWLAGRQLIGHSLSDSSVAYQVALTGGLYSTEGRLRALGTWISGASSSTDMQSHGSSGYVYTRLNQEAGHHHHVLLSPRVLARTSTYGFSSDNYGDINVRKTEAYFGLSQAAAHAGGSNETEIKDAVSMLDDIMLLNAGANRDKVISALKARGITQIRGLPVEDRVVDSITPDAIAKVKAAEPAPETWFEHPAEPWSPPSFTPAAGETSVVESEAEKAASIEATPADALANAMYSAIHSAAAKPEDVSQVFYQAPAKPASVLSEAPKLKAAVAKRVAGKMTSSEEQMKALADAAGLHAPESWGPDTRTRVAAALVATWAQSNSSPVALALQNIAHTMFGIQKEALPGLGFTDASSEAAAAELESGFASVLEDFLAAQWSETQAELAAGGVEHMTLYRVFHFSSVPEWAKNIANGDVIDAPQARPLSSWGFLQASAEAAGTFAAGGKTVVVKATVPAAMALAFPRTGFGCYNETEFVILDAPGFWEIVKVS